MSGPRRVFISGVGPITTFGVGMDPLWAALVEGRSGIAPITRFDASGFGCPFAAEVSAETFNPRQWVPKSYRKAAKVMSRDIELAVGAAAAAIAEAGLTTRGTDPDAAPTLPPARVGCHIGAGLIAADVDELTAALVSSVGDDGAFSLARWGEAGMQNLTPLWMLKYLPNMLACHVTIIHDCQGPSNTITCAEASGGLDRGEHAGHRARRCGLLPLRRRREQAQSDGHAAAAVRGSARDRLRRGRSSVDRAALRRRRRGHGGR
jgi:3-oxoacyl-[acyl-carrier-protein] synthase II